MFGQPLFGIVRAAFVFAGAMISVSTFLTAADSYRARCKCLPLALDTTTVRALFAVLFFWIIVQIVEFVVLRLTCAALRENILVATRRFRQPLDIEEKAGTLGGWFAASERNRNLSVY